MGAPRITAELNDGIDKGDDRRINRKAGGASDAGRRRLRGTASGAGCVPPHRDQAASKYPDLMGRDFTADAPNRKYVGDIPPLRGRCPHLSAAG